MSIFEAIVQGIVQGATEFLPVSSSGHLSLAQHIMGVKVDSLLFDILLHLGTLIAVCAVYYKLIWRLIKAFISLVADVFRGKFKWKDMDHDRRLLMMLMIGLIPLFLLFLPVPGTGMKLKDISELWASDSTIWIEGFALLMTSALLFLGIRASKGAKVHHFTRKDGKVGEIRGRTKFHTADAICVGVTQCAAAVFPGFRVPAPPWRQVFCAVSTSRQRSIIPSCSASRPFWRRLCSPLKMQSANRSTLASVR